MFHEIKNKKNQLLFYGILIQKITRTFKSIKFRKILLYILPTNYYKYSSILLELFFSSTNPKIGMSENSHLIQFASIYCSQGNGGHDFR